jgi:DNA-binding MltR family transcriptional regulator
MTKSMEDLFDDFAEDFLGESSSRIVIIVGASKIDDSLGEIIGKVLLPKLAKDKENDELLQGDNPLSTFSSKIKMAYRLGCIDITFYRVLEKIRKIRNIGAHQLAFDINSSPLKEHVVDFFNLVEDRKSFKLTKERFFPEDFETDLIKLQCAILTVCVILQIATQVIEETKVQDSIHKITSD